MGFPDYDQDAATRVVINGTEAVTAQIEDGISNNEETCRKEWTGARIPKFFGAAWLRHRSLVCGTTAVTEGRIEGGESRLISANKVVISHGVR